jgi:hypothetical protein
MKNLLFALALVSTIAINAESLVYTKLLLVAHTCNNHGDKDACKKLADFYAEVMKKNNPAASAQALEIQYTLDEIHYRLAGSRTWFGGYRCGKLTQKQIETISAVLQDRTFMATATKADLSDSWDLGAFIATEVKRRVHTEETLQRMLAEAQKKANAKN